MDKLNYIQLSFRKLQEDDLEFLNEVRNLYAKEFLHDSRTFSLRQTYEWFRKTNPDFYIIENDSTRIGYFRLSQWDKEICDIYIGADIHPKFTGKGLGFLSYKQFMPYLIEKYHLKTISLEVLSTNKRAYYLYEKIGFKQICIKETFVKNDNVVDSILMRYYC